MAVCFVLFCMVFPCCFGFLLLQVYFSSELHSGAVRSLLVSGGLFTHWLSNQTELFLLTSIAWNKKTWDLQYKAIVGE